MRGTWESGEKVIKLIGFDATETHRTFATGAGIDVCPEPGLPRYRDRYEIRYPLRDWGFDRAACGKIIVAAGLPLPPKSACFFCPNMKDAEIEELAAEDEVDHALALEMERVYRAGKHFRGDNSYSVNASHRQTGEKVALTIYAGSEAEARDLFRQSHDDNAKPFKYKVRVSPAVRGLGRDHSWAERFPLNTVAL